MPKLNTGRKFRNTTTTTTTINLTQSTKTKQKNNIHHATRTTIINANGHIHDDKTNTKISNSNNVNKLIQPSNKSTGNIFTSLSSQSKSMTIVDNNNTSINDTSHKSVVTTKSLMEIQKMNKELHSSGGITLLPKVKASSLSTTPTTTTTTSTNILSRGQKKRLQKRQQYMKKEQMILSSLKLHQQYEQSKRIDGLDAMKHALLETIHIDDNNNHNEVDTISDINDTKQQQQSSSEHNNTVSTNKHNNHNNTMISINNRKQRQQLIQKEIIHMNLILQHPIYQQNPITTIHEHLKNTFTNNIKSIISLKDNNDNNDKTNTITKHKINKNNIDGVHRKKKKNKFRATRIKRK